MKTTISNILRRKGTDVLTIEETATVYEAIEMMEDHRVGSIIALNEGDVTGIFTERDAMTRVLGGGLDSTHTLISEVMTPDPVCVNPSTSLENARALVTSRRIRHLPVVDDGKVVGLVSSGDLTHWQVRDQAGHIGEQDDDTTSD